MNRFALSKLVSLCLLFCLVLTGLACKQSSSSNGETVGQPSNQKSSSGEQDSAGTENSPNRQTAAGAESDRRSDRRENSAIKKSICELVSIQEVSGVTGRQYVDTTETANFTTIKHCEYRKQADAASLMIAFGETAKQRMESAKSVEHQPIAGFHDEAIWEPAQGKLTVLAGNRCCEIDLSHSHGEEPQRIEMSRKLVDLLIAKFGA